MQPVKIGHEHTTDYWATRDIKKGEAYAVLTNLIHQEWSGVSVNAHKGLKGLKTQNLRDLGRIVLPPKNTTEETQHQKLEAERGCSNHAHQQLPRRKLHLHQPKDHERRK